MNSQPCETLEYSLYSEEPQVAHITGALINALHNVITNTWDPNIHKECILLEGRVFKKMRIHGYFIRSGDNIGIRHDESYSTPWFAKIIRFIHFDQVSFL